VMEYVNGVSAGDHRRRMGTQALDEATALDICIGATSGLEAAHMEGIVHRDIKPDNIMIPRSKQTGQLQFAVSKLADLGLARAEDSTGGPTLTGQQSSMGTPGYMAPEQALNARKAGKPADIFSMGATLYALLGGASPFKGETSTETIYATLQKPHQPIRELRPEVSLVTSELLDRCLEKDPARRFPDARALLQALKLCRANAAAPEGQQLQALQTLEQLQKASEAGLAVRPTDSGSGTPPPLASPAAQTGPAAAPSAAGTAPGASGRRSFLIVAAAMVAGMAGLGAWVALKDQPDPSGDVPKRTPAESKTKFGFAFCTEKEDWVRWALAEFAKTSAGAVYEVEPIMLPAVDAEVAILNGDTRIHAWSPANTMDGDLLELSWKKKHGKTPFVNGADCLQLTPLVFVIYKSRLEAFRTKYGTLDFSTLVQAQQDKANWKSIANKPEWGRLTFGIPHPAHFAAGQATLVLLAHQCFKEDKVLTLEEAQAPQLQAWASCLQPFMRTKGSPTSLMRDLLRRGPSAYDGVMTFESIALAELKDAATTHGELAIVYPEVNIWNDHPCYILDATWSNGKQRAGARALLDFLLGKNAQQEAVVRGARPGNTAIRIDGPESPFKRLQQAGVQLDIANAVEDPTPEVTFALLELARKLEGGAVKPGGEK